MKNFIPPQLFLATDEIQAKAGWLYELKYDGYRAQVHVTHNDVRIFTRTGLDWTHRFRLLARQIGKAITVPCILDGEVFSADINGRPDFTRLCNNLDGSSDLQFAAFDVLALEGADTKSLPLRMRRRHLTAALRTSSSAVHIVLQSPEPRALLDFARTHGWEGIVAKAADSPYLPGTRSPDWRKFKCKRRQEFVIAGWRPDPGSGALKSLVLATFEQGTLTLRGSVGTGFTLDQRRELPAIFVPSRDRHFDLARSDFLALEPGLVAEVEYLELSSHGILRQPNFLGLRTDKAAKEVHIECADVDLAVGQQR